MSREWHPQMHLRLQVLSQVWILALLQQVALCAMSTPLSWSEEGEASLVQDCCNINSAKRLKMLNANKCKQVDHPANYHKEAKHPPGSISSYHFLPLVHQRPWVPSASIAHAQSSASLLAWIPGTSTKSWHVASVTRASKYPMISNDIQWSYADWSKSRINDHIWLSR
jgi:hypothetical protein